MASSSRLLLLRRGDHNSRLTEGFEALLDKESMTDVSITCGQQIIKAHRTVLSIFSPFFKRVFDSVTNPLHYPFIVLKDMPYADLMAIIDLMYRGEVTVTQDQFTSLKSSAKVLEVSELSDIISSYEEKNDIKPKIEDNITSSARNTRKRGRPRRYAEDSDEDYRIEETPPPTKRQQALQSSRAGATTSTAKKTIVQTITPKIPTATRGGASLSFSRQPNIRLPTGIRGGHSAFSKPQTATRGGHTTVTLNKPQIATRGGLSTRGRTTRQSLQEIDEDFHPSQETRRTSGRRGRVGRPPRTASLTREDNGMPMATSLPLSLPEPIQLSLNVDLGNIYPNYNMNAVSSSTSSAQKATVPVQFEQTIKQEPDSDSEVECIMSGTSPLPSGVMEEGPEIIETSINKAMNDANQESGPQIIAPQNPTEVELPVHNSPDKTPESARNETIQIEDEPEVESHILPPNLIIKTERSDSPVPEILETTEQDTEQDAIVSSVTRNSAENEEHVTNVNEGVGTTSPSERVTESVPVTISSVSSVNNTIRDTNVPLLRFIKTERISPASVVQTSFQPIEGQTSDQSNSCEPQVSNVSTVPILTRIKIERISPKNVEKDIRNDSIEKGSTPEVNESSDVTSSHNQELTVQITNVFSERQNLPIQRNQTTDVTNNDNNECTSSSSQPTTDDNSRQQSVVDNTDADNEIDVQNIAFDCFYSNDDQQMQTHTTEVATSSVSFAASGVNSFIGFNNTLENIDNLNNNNFTQILANNTNQISFSSTSATNSIITSSVPTQQQFFAVNSSQQQMTNTSNANTFSLDNNNVVMNSPLHSDEECMLLDSPQQSAIYEVTIGSEHNLDDSMDNL